MHVFILKKSMVRDSKNNKYEDPGLYHPHRIKKFRVATTYFQTWTLNSNFRHKGEIVKVKTTSC